MYVVLFGYKFFSYFILFSNAPDKEKNSTKLFFVHEAKNNCCDSSYIVILVDDVKLNIFSFIIFFSSFLSYMMMLKLYNIFYLMYVDIFKLFHHFVLFV